MEVVNLPPLHCFAQCHSFACVFRVNLMVLSSQPITPGHLVARIHAQRVTTTTIICANLILYVRCICLSRMTVDLGTGRRQSAARIEDILDANARI